MRAIKIIVMFCCVAAVVKTSMAVSPSSDVRAFMKLANESELVFHGTVKRIDYRNFSNDAAHTFVTYVIKDVLKGDYRQPTITIRFAGGYYMDDNNRVTGLQISRVPHIRKGEQDVYLIRSNNIVQCPLIDCIEGRFHFTKGVIVNNARMLLQPDADKRITWVADHTSYKRLTNTGQ